MEKRMFSKKTMLIPIFYISLTLGFFFLPGIDSYSQKHTQNVNQVWLQYANQTRFSRKWGVWLDLHLRTKEDFFDNFSTSIIRPGLTYYLKDNVKLTVGYAYVNHFPQEGHTNISRPEHRPWQQIQWHTNYPKLKLMQWIRLEERFRRKVLNNDELAEGHNFNYKIRYNILAMFPLSKRSFQPKSLSFILNDEVHINFGKEIVYNYYDQNRFFAGFAYHVNKADNIQVGYMHLFQQLASGNRYRTTHAGRISYFHNLDLRKEKK